MSHVFLLRAFSDAPASLPVPAHDLHALPPDSRPARGLLHADVCVADGGLLGFAAGASERDGGQVLAGFVCPDERLAGVLGDSAVAEAWWLGLEDPLILSASGGRSSASTAVPARAIFVAAARFEALAPGLGECFRRCSLGGSVVRRPSGDQAALRRLLARALLPWLVLESFPASGATVWREEAWLLDRWPMLGGVDYELRLSAACRPLLPRRGCRCGGIGWRGTFLQDILSSRKAEPASTRIQRPWQP